MYGPFLFHGNWKLDCLLVLRNYSTQFLPIYSVAKIMKITSIFACFHILHISLYVLSLDINDPNTY